MERDFLSITGGGAEEEAKVSRHDSGSSRQWPLTKNASSFQQFIPLKVAQENTTNTFSFDLLSSPMFQPMKVADAFAQQKSFSLHDHPLQVTAGLSASSRRASGTRSFPMTSPNSDVNSDPFFEFHNAQHQFGGATLNNPFVNMNIGTLGPRNVSAVATKMTAQLTIFYAGTVHVYDDVSFDKAEAIIALVSKGSNSKGTLNASRSNAPFKVTAPVPTNFPASDSLSTKQILCPTPLRVASPCSGFSKAMLVSPMAGAISRSSFSTPSDNVGAKITSSLSPSIKQEPSRTLPSTFGSTVAVAASSQAVPQARKASLARFLEKRNERVKNAMPYSTSKKNHETGCDLESANASSISSSTDVNLSSNWSRIPNCP